MPKVCVWNWPEKSYGVWEFANGETALFFRMKGVFSEEREHYASRDGWKGWLFAKGQECGEGCTVAPKLMSPKKLREAMDLWEQRHWQTWADVQELLANKTKLMAELRSRIDAGEK